ncbi:glycosyltransferase [Candidatus Daviesbacteria bacterium]|nr:glycosyltransferase [Candidatus Daviesbacteria bacterium]
MKTQALSVFFPSVNEEGNIEITVGKADKVLKRLDLDYEIIVVNDGSTDHTRTIAENLAKKNSKIRVINHQRNLGYGEALKSGFYNAKYDTIVYTDGDGQFDFSEVVKFLENIEDHDLVIGYRIKRQDSFLRKLFGKGWRLSLLIFFGLRLKDVDCGFKMIKRKVLETIPHLESQRGAMINAELVIKTKKFGFNVTQVGVNHYPRLAGKPTGANIRVIIKSYLDLIRLWWKLKNQKLLFMAFLLILSLATFLRFFKLSEYMTFLGDEGRDALVVKDMLTNYHFPLIGPPTSVGNIYLGPLYYYMMAFSMMIFWLNPIAAAMMNALVGVAVVVLIYCLGKIWFNKAAGLIASFFYAISPITIIYSKSSWNPNPAPFFALISMLGLYKVNKTGNFLWLILTGIMVAAALQMHYLALILIPICAVIWLYEILFRIQRKEQIRHFFMGTSLGILFFLLVMSPLFWFDLRHNLLNYRGIIELMSSDSAIKGNLFNNLLKIPNLYSYNLIGRYIAGENLILTWILSLVILIPFAASIYQRVRSNKIIWPYFVLGVWLFVGLLGLSFYQQGIYDHYLGFMNPVPFLLLGSLATVKYKKKITKVLLLSLVLLLAYVNLQKNPLNNKPNNQLKRTQDVARFVINKTEGKDFNFALIAESNYDAAYQFYLDQYDHKPKQVPFDITDQLFVVCEDSVCDPTHNAKYEVAAFGWSKIDWMEEYSGVKLYKLIHNPSGKP